MSERRMKRFFSIIAWCFIAVFVIFVLHETVFSRPITKDFKYNFQPFWSYSAITNGKKYLIKEHFLNVALFIPMGVSLWFALKQKQWWKAMAIGCIVSICIEMMQLLLKRGLCELDDVFHNTLGTIIGFGLVSLVSRFFQRKNKPFEDKLMP